MSKEKPGSSEEARIELKNILSDLHNRANNAISSVFGPLEESGISREQFIDFQKEIADIEDPTERAKEVYRFYKANALNVKVDESFEDFIRGIESKKAP